MLRLLDQLQAGILNLTQGLWIPRGLESLLDGTSLSPGSWSAESQRTDVRSALT